MKLLFDENLSFKLPRILSSDFPGSRHVRNCGLKGSPDGDIWEYANGGIEISSTRSVLMNFTLLPKGLLPIVSTLSLFGAFKASNACNADFRRESRLISVIDLLCL